jgi:pyruvate,water dikinase
MTPVPLSSAFDEPVYGGKAVQLGAAIRAGLPVPDGFALGTAFVEDVVSGDSKARSEVQRLCALLPGCLAVRSSAIGEDSAGASFAGQHATILNAIGPQAVIDAIVAVWQSAHTDSAKAYRARLNTSADIRMGVVVQRLVAADVAGVLFTCNPVTGNQELVVEASWGLGEAVVQGLVVPDSYRMDPAGSLLEGRPGYKTIKVQRLPNGGTTTETVSEHLVEKDCLDAKKLAALHTLAERCLAVFGAGPHDIEWAFEQDSLFLLQRRPVTTAHAS